MEMASVQTAICQDSTYFGIKYADATQLSKTNFVLRPRRVMGVLPYKVDNLERDFPPIQNQGSIGSCASWASAYGVMSFIQKKKSNYTYLNPSGELDESRVFSPLFVFNQVRDRSARCDSAGSVIADNLDLMQKLGVCKKATFDPQPYTYQICDVDPTRSNRAMNEAKRFKIDNYGWFISWDQKYVPGYKLQRIKELLFSGYPIIVGADIDYTFWRYGGQRVGNQIIWTRFDNNYVGAHAMVIVGYNDSLRAIRIFNSWGNWGNNGFGWISYDLIDNQIFEAYVVNHKDLPTVTTVNALSQPSVSQKDTSFNLIENRDTMFFVKNRFLTFNNIKLMPIEISERDSSATLKVFKEINGDDEQVDVFSIRTGEYYEFIVDRTLYGIKVVDIRPYRIFSRPAVFFTLTNQKANQ